MSVLKTCARCKRAKPLSDFYKSKQTKDGLYPYCKECKREAQRAVSRAWYWDKMGGERQPPNYDWEHRKEYLRAKRAARPVILRAFDAVQRAVKKGVIPPAKALTCSECGQPAQDYHHHKGYDEGHKLDVVPLCRKCHGLTRRID